MHNNSKVNLADISVGAVCPYKLPVVDGNESTRLCSNCDTKVYNIAEMTRKEAELLLTNRSGDLCVRLSRRKDGSLVTKDRSLNEILVHWLPVKVRDWATIGIAILNTLASFVGLPALASPQESEPKPPSEVNLFNVEGTVIDPHYSHPQTSAAYPAGANKVDEAVKRIRAQAVPTAHMPTDRSAMDSFVCARNYEDSKDYSKALGCYADSIKALRNSGTEPDPNFVQTVAKYYSSLLRKQKRKSEAQAIEKEFLKK